MNEISMIEPLCATTKRGRFHWHSAPRTRILAAKLFIPVCIISLHNVRRGRLCLPTQLSPKI